MVIDLCQFLTHMAHTPFYFAFLCGQTFVSIHFCVPWLYLISQIEFVVGTQ